MQNLRAAVIGVGYLGAFHAEKYHSLPGVELIAVVDTNLDKAMQVASRFGAEAHAGHRKILEQVDVVSIAAPTLYHYPIARDCLEAGLHVLLEKPITDTLSCAQSLIELARKNGLVLQIGHLEQFNPAVRMIHKNIVEPIYIECHRMAPFSMRGADVDVVLDLMIHDIEILLSLLDSTPTNLHCVGRSVRTPHIDIANAHLEFQNGCVANITASRISQHKIRRIRVLERDTYCSVDCSKRSVSFFTKQPISRAHPAEPVVVNIEEHAFDDSDLLLAEIRAFIHAVRNRTRPLVSGEDGMRALEIALEITRQMSPSGSCPHQQSAALQ